MPARNWPPNLGSPSSNAVLYVPFCASFRTLVSYFDVANLPHVSKKTDAGVKPLWNKIIGAALTAHSKIDDIVAKMASVLPHFKTLTGGPLTIPGRRLVKDGQLTRFIPWENRKKEVYVALFNDCLVICKPKYGGSGTIMCRTAIPFSSAIILEGPSNEKKSTYFFRIHHIVKAKTYDFLVHTLAEKNDWLDILEELTNSQKGTGNQVTPTALIEEFSLKNMNRLIKRSARVFGVGLADAVQKQSFRIHSEVQLDPYITAQAFEFLRKESALKTRGIFQVPSLDRQRVRFLKQQWNTGMEPICEGNSSEVIADLIILFFEQLPLSVIPREFTELLMAFYDLPDESKRIDSICALLNACPPSNFAVLVDVLVYLGYAAEQSHYNGLTTERAGLVFSRLLMHFEPKDYRKCSEIITLAVQNVDRLMETHNASNGDFATGKLPSNSALSTYRSTFRPVPRFLFDVNRKRQLECVNKCKYKLLEIIKLIAGRSQRGDHESALQSMLITLNLITDYEPTFVRHFMDIGHLNTFYLRLMDLNRLLSLTKVTKGSKATKLFASTTDALEAERIRTALWDALEAALDYLDRACNWNREVRVAYFKIRKELERAQELKQALGIPRDTELDSTMAALQPMYADAPVREFWDRNFGLEKFIVKVDLFIDALLRLNDSTLTDTERQIVRHILDHHQTGRVNIYRFAIFVSGYGPIENCLANVIKMSSEKWFYGFASYPESVRLLEGSPIGTFLVRFSQTNPGNFSVDYLAAAPTMPGMGSPARSEPTTTEFRTLKIHNSPGGFEVVRSEIDPTLSTHSSGTSSATSSAPNSAPNSAPSSEKLGTTPQSAKLVTAQGSFRMRTMTLLQAPQRRGSVTITGVLSSIPAHLQRPPTPTSSPPGSIGFIPTPPVSPPPSGSLPIAPTASPSSPQAPPPKPPPLSDYLTHHLQSLTFHSIEGVLDHLKDLLHRPLQPNYFLLPYFHGCIDKSSAIKKLSGHHPGTYLARFGDDEGTIDLHVVVPASAHDTGDLVLSSFQSEPAVDTHTLERIAGTSQLRRLVDGVTFASLPTFIASLPSGIPMSMPLPLVQDLVEEQAVIEDGTLEKIVEKLYNGTEIGVAQVFLLTYRAFATPTAVLNILRERIYYHREHNQDRTYRLRMGNFVKTWLTEYVWDIREDKDFYKLCSKLATDLASDPSTSAIGQQLNILLQKLQEGGSTSSTTLAMSSSQINISGGGSFSNLPSIPLSQSLSSSALFATASTAPSVSSGAGKRTLRADRCAALHAPVPSLASSTASDISSTLQEDDSGFGEKYDDDDELTSSGGGSPVGSTTNSPMAASPSPLHASASGSPIIGSARRSESGPALASPRDSIRDRSSISMSSGSVSTTTTGNTLRNATLRSAESVAPGMLIKSVLEIPVTDLAEQLTLIEFEVFTAIPLHEFLQQGWLKSDKDTRSPNLLRMVRLSTRLSRWVVSEILADDKPVKRAKLIEYFVQLCHELLKLSNFNGIMAVLAALSGSAVGRLKKTWDAFSKTKKKELDELHSIMDTELNWSKYRTSLLNAPPPKIPYLGLVLTDLVFIEDGNPDRLESGHINWVKCQRLAECLHGVQLCQQSAYQLTPNESLVDPYILEVAKTMNEREAYERSVTVEPRNPKKNKK